jgi:hypothetical protein
VAEDVFERMLVDRNGAGLARELRTDGAEIGDGAGVA